MRPIWRPRHTSWFYSVASQIADADLIDTVSGEVKVIAKQPTECIRVHRIAHRQGQGRLHTEGRLQIKDINPIAKIRGNGNISIPIPCYIGISNDGGTKIRVGCLTLSMDQRRI